MFTPELTLLTTTNEFINFSFEITYNETSVNPLDPEGPPLIGIEHPVTITTEQPNATVNITDNIISGYFSDSFDNNIFYRTLEDTFKNVKKFNEIDLTEMYATYFYLADQRRSITYEYLAEANGEQLTYQIIVLNNWTPNRNLLLKYVNEDRYQQLVSEWTNLQDIKVNWFNMGSIITWENNSL